MNSVGEQPASDALGRNVWIVAAVVVLGSIGTILATTSINVTLGALAEELGAEVDTVQWVATGYLLGLAATIATTGWLMRRFGARRLYHVSLLIFATTSVLCAAASSIEMLIAFRVAQGAAGGATMPLGMMMIASVSGPERMGRVMSVVGVPMILGPIAGPAVAGVLVDYLSWHWVFLMNVPLSLGALALGLRLLPPIPSTEAGPFDVRGFLLMVVGTPALVYGLARLGQSGSLTDPIGVPAIVVGVVALGAFVRHGRRSARPLLDLRLWENRGFSACALTAFLVSATLFGTMLVLPLAFISVFDVSAATAGAMIAPQGIAAAISIAIAGRLTDRIGGGRVAVGGIAILAVGTIPVLFFDASTPPWLIFAALFLRGLGIGGSIVPAMAAAYLHLRREEVPDATPQLNVLQRLGGAIGSTVLALALASRLPDIAGGAAAATPAQAASAFHLTFAVSLVICILALIPALALALLERRRDTPNGGVDGLPQTAEPELAAA